MATSHLNLHSLRLTIFTSQAPNFKIKHCSPITSHKPKHQQLFAVSNSTFPNKDDTDNLFHSFKFRVGRLRSVLPGGSWWNLSGNADEVEDLTAKPITVPVALSRMWSLIGDDKWLIYLAVASLIVAAVSEISMPSILAASIFSAQRGETVVFSRSLRFLVMLCVVSGICSGLRSGCFSMANIILDISFFDAEAVGVLTSRLGADCQQLSYVIGNHIHLILRNSLQGMGALINLLTLSWPLTLSALVVCSILSTVFLVYGQYKHWLEKLAFISIRESVAHGLWTMSFTTLYRSTQVWITSYKSIGLYEWGVQLGQLVIVIAVLLGGMSIMTGYVSAEQLTKCEIAWTDGAYTVCKRFFSLSFEGDRCYLFLIDLYKEICNSGMITRMVPILDHLCLNVKANEVVAIVGLSGSGKSTVVNLLLRLYEPTNGQIYIDGFPLTELDIGWLREKIGFVGQEPHLFHMDIKSNISYGCPRDITDEDVEWAAKQAYAHEFISSLPHGYETIVDDDLLSGGQKQRIAIARAILRDPVILILDEATSALDSESEHYVKGILHALRNDTTAKRTVIVIAHRLSTIKAVDRIFVIDDGQIVEMGDHTELLHKGGLYAHMGRSALICPVTSNSCADLANLEFCQFLAFLTMRAPPGMSLLLDGDVRGISAP
ncbi:hypothetical protein JRO89_XS01G0234100 [Xanthoceras sorbifolium]|uniref:ABC transporter B family member 26, chloroplastic n=1 Tax=Xanthoceras sorbifolium TaxID=99658 RepID=A0ABQ8IKS9_9ROSI|nr:hypothetical protein JRO89_XS01G0234100 [Xanthoceras sorbifolium]